MRKGCYEEESLMGAEALDNVVVCVLAGLCYS